jgi:hypothetical protein
MNVVIGNKKMGISGISHVVTATEFCTLPPFVAFRA